jgi:hypothetical protein
VHLTVFRFAQMPFSDDEPHHPRFGCLGSPFAWLERRLFWAAKFCDSVANGWQRFRIHPLRESEKREVFFGGHNQSRLELV